MALWVKPGVDFRGLKPEILVAVVVASEVYNEFGCQCTVTSALDGTHGKVSLHLKGLAVDLRTRVIGKYLVERIVETLKERLGKQYDVVLEKDHIHMEFDPT